MSAILRNKKLIIILVLVIIAAAIAWYFLKPAEHPRRPCLRQWPAGSDGNSRFHQGTGQTDRSVFPRGSRSESR